MQDLINSLASTKLPLLMEFGLTNVYLPLAILMASLLGSTHCAGMCGPIVIAFTKSKSQRYMYNLGRLFSYLIMAGLVHLFGKELINSIGLTGLHLSSAFIISVFFIFWGIILLFKNSPDAWFPPSLKNIIQKTVQKAYNWNLKNCNNNSFLLGLFSALLPCGWLYSFLISLIAIPSLVVSFFLIIIFWIGTLPVMQFSLDFLQSFFKSINSTKIKWVGVLLILIGLFGVYNKMNQIHFDTTDHTELNCHQ